MPRIEHITENNIEKNIVENVKLINLWKYLVIHVVHGMD